MVKSLLIALSVFGFAVLAYPCEGEWDRHQNQGGIEPGSAQVNALATSPLLLEREIPGRGKAQLIFLDIINTQKPAQAIIRFFSITGELMTDGEVTKVELWMPHHGHGSVPTKVTKIQAGEFLIENMYFLMKGHWDIKVYWTQGGTETVVLFNLAL